MKTLIAAALTLSSLALAAPPQAAAAAPQQKPQAQGFGGWDDDRFEGRREEREKHMRMMLVVGIADALGLSEGDAIRLADKMKGFDEKRKPLREQMHDSMRLLKAAADGDQAALGKVDQATTALLDLRAQMAAVDKEMFLTVSKDLQPKQKAQLALFLARFMHEARGGRGMGGGMGPGMGPGPGGGMRGGRHHGGF